VIGEVDAAVIDGSPYLTGVPQVVPPSPGLAGSSLTATGTYGGLAALRDWPSVAYAAGRPVSHAARLGSLLFFFARQRSLMRTHHGSG